MIAVIPGGGVEKPSETLRAQLGLADGVGLVVNFVEDHSPARAAGLRQHDVIERLDDQLLVNEEQLVTLVRLRKSGDPVTLAVLRGGKPVRVNVQLGEKEVSVRAPNEMSAIYDYTFVNAMAGAAAGTAAGIGVAAVNDDDELSEGGHQTEDLVDEQLTDDVELPEAVGGVERTN